MSASCIQSSWIDSAGTAQSVSSGAVPQYTGGMGLIVNQVGATVNVARAGFFSADEIWGYSGGSSASPTILMGLYSTDGWGNVVVLQQGLDGTGAPDATKVNFALGWDTESVVEPGWYCFLKISEGAQGVIDPTGSLPASTVPLTATLTVSGGSPSGSVSFSASGLVPGQIYLLQCIDILVDGDTRQPYLSLT